MRSRRSDAAPANQAARGRRIASPIVSGPLPARRSVPGAAAVMLLDALEQVGGDVEGALRASGLTRPGTKLRREGIEELSRFQFARLAQECVIQFDRHCYLRDGRPFFSPRHLRMLCLTALACPTLEVAIRNAIEFYGMFMRGTARLDFTIDGGFATMTMDLGLRERGVGELLVAVYGLTNFHRFFGWLIGGEVPLTRVTLAFTSALEQSGLSELVQIRPEFDSDVDSISFPTVYLSRPIVRDYREFSRLFTLFPFDLLPPDYGGETLSQQVRIVLHAAIARGDKPPVMRRLSRMFGLTEATFRRRLEAEGTSLIKLRRQCREELAMELLANPRLTIKEIGTRLQFNDSATFRRAFRSWKGLSPSQVRSGR